MQKLGNYITGKWIEGDGEGQLLYNAVNGIPIVAASSEGLDFAAILQFAREKGNPALRKMTFQERGRMLRALAQHLMQHKENFYSISYQSGATRIDSWIDIEGGIGNLFSNASLRRKLPDETFCLDGDPISLSKGNSFTLSDKLGTESLEEFVINMKGADAMPEISKEAVIDIGNKLSVFKDKDEKNKFKFPLLLKISIL